MAHPKAALTPTGRLILVQRIERGRSDADVDVVARTAPAMLPETSVFRSEDELSRFFQQAPVGRSPHRERLASVRLETARWEMHSVEVTEVRSAFYDDTVRFPAGTISFDSAAIMRRIPALWKADPSTSRAA